MPRVTHFEISADEPERAVKFYNDVFNWQIDKWEGPIDYWLATTGSEAEPGIDGAIMDRNPNQAVINTIDVPSLDDFIEKVTDAGGRIVSEKMAVPGVGYAAYFADTEGNVFGLMEEDESAS